MCRPPNERGNASIAASSSPQLWYRSAGFFSHIFSTIRTTRSSQTTSSARLGSGVFTCIIITSTLFFASNGLRPASRWKAVIPSE